MGLMKKCKSDDCKKRVYKDNICADCYSIKQQLEQNKLLSNMIDVLIDVKHNQQIQTKAMQLLSNAVNPRITENVLKSQKINENDNSDIFIPSFEQYDGEIIKKEIKKTTTKVNNINETIEKLKLITKGN